VCAVAGAVTLSACTGTTPPTVVPAPAPPTPDPPKITCPAPQTAQAVDGGAIAVSYAAPIVTSGQTPVATTCSPAAGSSFTLGQKTVTCTVTDALQRTDTCAFTVTVTSPPKLSTTSFLAFGDSITYGEDGQNSTAPSAAIMSSRFHPAVQVPFSQQYPEDLRKDLAGRYTTQAPSVANKGQPGEAAADSATLTRFANLTSSRAYSVALIMEGSNDIFYGDAANVPLAIAGLQKMVRNAKGLGLKTYLATIPPMNPPACDPVCRGRDAWPLVSGLNDNIRALARDEGVTLVDVYQGFGGDLSLVGADGLHPSAAGYARIADLFFTAIKQSLELPSVSATGVRTLHARTASTQ